MPTKGRQLLRHSLEIAISSALEGHTNEYPALPSALGVQKLLVFVPSPRQEVSGHSQVPLTDPQWTSGVRSFPGRRGNLSQSPDIKGFIAAQII